MEQLINSGGGGDELVKIGWDRYGQHKPTKSIITS
jgi:hypothetical protein